MSVDDPTDEDLRFITKFPDKCCAEVSRNGESQPCDKVAVAVALQADGYEDNCWWPVCPFHTRGRKMVPLADLIRHLNG